MKKKYFNGRDNFFSINIKFSLIREDPKSSLPKFIKKNNIGYVVTDFSPLRVYQKRTKIILNQ